MAVNDNRRFRECLARFDALAEQREVLWQRAQSVANVAEPETDDTPVRTTAIDDRAAATAPAATQLATAAESNAKEACGV